MNKLENKIMDVSKILVNIVNDSSNDYDASEKVYEKLLPLLSDKKLIWQKTIEKYLK